MTFYKVPPLDFCGSLEAEKNQKYIIKCLISSLFNIHQTLHSLAKLKNKQLNKQKFGATMYFPEGLENTTLFPWFFEKFKTPQFPSEII